MSHSSFFKPLELLDGVSLPEKFTFPFYYEPHPLSLEASKQLQAHIDSLGWQHLKEEQGKMFGVLVVKDSSGVLGYLSAFSGKILNSNQHEGFVPPVFDMLAPDGFFVAEMNEVMTLVNTVSSLENDPEYEAAQLSYEDTLNTSKITIEAFREEMRQAKADRKMRRLEGQIEMTGDALKRLEKTLEKESLSYKHRLRVLTDEWNEKVKASKEILDVYTSQLTSLKKQRKERSNALQQKLFDQYNFLSAEGTSKNVRAIFAETVLKVPPSAAGECAAPKLLQFAYQHDMTPICMAEFWYGKPPKSEIRKHLAFYPSCRGKCEPILGHMLKGLAVDDNPLLEIPTTIEPPEIIFEDDYLIVLNKPEGMLSVEGKTQLPSIQKFAEEHFPRADRPMIIHRLDMATSGILILSKTKEANKRIQSQFIKRSMKKRYVAVLDGNLETDSGMVDLPMKQNFNERPKQMVCREEGKSAITKYEVIERSNGTTRVYFYPITGRSHQLRVHAAHVDGLNLAIVGDDLYGTKANRLHLHAEFIEFEHPITKERLQFTVEAPF